MITPATGAPVSILNTPTSTVTHCSPVLVAAEPLLLLAQSPDNSMSDDEQPTVCPDFVASPRIYSDVESAIVYNVLVYLLFQGSL